jgi:hypothetical protein
MIDSKVPQRNLVVAKMKILQEISSNPSKLSKNRQFLTTILGIRKLKELGCTHFIKMRTDQYFLINDLITYILDLESKSALGSKLIVPCRLRSDPRFIQDFYFAGKIDEHLDFFNYFMISNEIYESVHYDFFYKMSKYKSDFKYDVLSYFPKESCLTTNQLVIIERNWRDHLLPGPRSVWNSLIWRGEQLLIPEKVSPIGIENLSFSNDIAEPLAVSSSEVSFFASLNLYAFFRFYISNSNPAIWLKVNILFERLSKARYQISSVYRGVYLKIRFKAD